jgi:phosphoglycolate phosphatase
MYIGDTDVDMQTGHRAGMYTVGVLWGFRSRKELEENHADRIVERPAELLEL